jgi:hypothetical protein
MLTVMYKQLLKILTCPSEKGISTSAQKFLHFPQGPATAGVNPKKPGIPFLPAQCTPKWQKVHFFLDQTNS